VNLEEIVAWKNGNFYFDNKDLKTILSEFARWYDIDVQYEGNIKPRTFFGIVRRDRTLAHVLQLLHDNNIQFRIEGRTLTVHSD
jgi:ferric-dicitrate binding protein FerR (iron transport regulator)